MPSDSKKKDQQRKKDAAKKRQGAVGGKPEAKAENGNEKVENGVNGEKPELTAEEILCKKLEDEAVINAEAR